MGRLAKIYRASGGRPGDEGALEVALAMAAAEGRRAWPAVDLDPEVFARYLAERCPDLPDPALRAADLYLACACVHEVAGARELLESTYLARIPILLSRAADTAEVADDVRQQLRQRLLVGDDGAPTRLASYRGRGSLESWLRAAAARLALNLLRADQRQRRAHARAAAETELVLANPESDYLKRLERPQLEQAVRGAFAALTSRERAILRLHYVEGVGIGQIARSYAVHRGTLSRWLVEAQRHLLDSTRATLRERLGLEAAECDSYIDMLRSRLDLALSKVFTPER